MSDYECSDQFVARSTYKEHAWVKSHYIYNIYTSGSNCFSLSLYKIGEISVPKGTRHRWEILLSNGMWYL